VTRPTRAPGRIQVLVLGTADWNQPIATNQHYAVRELCKDPLLEVTFVESMGLRRPEFRLRDLRRMGRRIFAIFGPRSPRDEWRPRPEGLSVVSPLVIPWHLGPAAWVNQMLLRRRLRGWSQATQRKLLWVYTPVTYGLEVCADAVVYHCVDLLAEVEGIDTRVVEAGERRLADAGAVAIGTSRVVADHLQGCGFSEVHCWENVADTEVISSASPESARRVPGRVIFAGNLAPQKVDFDLMKSLSRAGLDVVVAGPRAEGGGSDEVEFAELIEAGVTYLGMLKLEELAQELVQCTVGLIPYRLNDYTRGVSPLKTSEYLAAGLAVVASDLPGVDPHGLDVMRLGGPGEFVKAVRGLSPSLSSESIQRRVALALRHSWQARGDQLRVLTRRLAA
jgi:teichuronic acid biosynthesis glycosyltransferase TuaH